MPGVSMTDWKRAMLLIEYDDGVQAVYEFTELTEATFSRQLVNGARAFRGKLRLSGTMAAVKWEGPQPSELPRSAIEGQVIE